jgi:hypothetical protein
MVWNGAGSFHHEVLRLTINPGGAIRHGHGEYSNTELSHPWECNVTVLGSAFYECLAHE